MYMCLISKSGMMMIIEAPILNNINVTYKHGHNTLAIFSNWKYIYLSVTYTPLAQQKSKISQKHLEQPFGQFLHKVHKRNLSLFDTRKRTQIFFLKTRYFVSHFNETFIRESDDCPNVRTHTSVQLITAILSA